MIQEFIMWYQKLDQDTLRLLRRFMAKAFSMPNANEYIKRVLSAELNTIDTNGYEQKEMDNG